MGSVAGQVAEDRAGAGVNPAMSRPPSAGVVRYLISEFRQPNHRGSLIVDVSRAVIRLRRMTRLDALSPAGWPGEFPEGERCNWSHRLRSIRGNCGEVASAQVRADFFVRRGCGGAGENYRFRVHGILSFAGG